MLIQDKSMQAQVNAIQESSQGHAHVKSKSMLIQRKCMQGQAASTSQVKSNVKSRSCPRLRSSQINPGEVESMENIMSKQISNKHKSCQIKLSPTSKQTSKQLNVQTSKQSSKQAKTIKG